MYELIQVANNSYYVNCPAKIGIYRNPDNSVYLIDSGNDKEAGRKVRQILDKNGWKLKAILNTHSNADHTGGCAYLQKQYHCKVFSSGMEAAITTYPVLEPSFLYGAYPFKELRHKFLMAQPCEVTPFTDADFPKEVEILPLPGHFFDMVGFRLPDGTAFIADCLSSAETLEKYQISFLYDLAGYLDTLDKVAAMDAKMFVPSHAAPTEDITPLCRLNGDTVKDIAAHILSLCTAPITFEDLLTRLFDDYGLTLTYEQYVLIGSTVRSYLAYLKDAGQLDGLIENNRLLWKAV